MEKLYFEDFQPGMRFETATRTLTADDIAGFARQHDPQPFHLDARLAEHSVFAGLAASGWQTATTSMRLVVDLLADRVAGGLVAEQHMYGQNKVKAVRGLGGSVRAAYSDSASDLPMLRLAREVVLVNGNSRSERKVRKGLGGEPHLQLVTWRTDA